MNECPPSYFFLHYSHIYSVSIETVQLRVCKWNISYSFNPQAAGSTEVLVPGDPERRHITMCDAQGGIPYHPNQIDNMVSPCQSILFLSLRVYHGIILFFPVHWWDFFINILDYLLTEGQKKYHSWKISINAWTKTKYWLHLPESLGSRARCGAFADALANSFTG